MALLTTIENDLKAAGNWLEDEVEEAGSAVWGVVKSVFNANTPGVINTVITDLKTFLTTVTAEVATGTPLETLEQNFVMWALKEGKIVLGDVEQLGSTLVQALIALTIKSLPSG